jgi:lipopolysaccharide export system permease protein
MMIVIWDLLGHLSKFIRAKTNVADIAIYYSYFVITTIEYLAPVCLLLATLYSLCQLTRNNELVAMRACGFSLHRIMLPFLSVGLLFTIASAVIKETVAVKAFEWTESFERRDYRRQSGPTESISLNYYNSDDRRIWYVERFSPGTPELLHGVKVSEERADGTRVRDLIADRAEWLDGSWWFHNLHIQKYGDGQDLPAGDTEPALPGESTVKELAYLTEEPVDFSSELRPWQFLSTWEMFKYVQQNQHISEQTSIRKRLDIHSRIAMPWMCLIVTLLGIPAGATTGRQNPLGAIFASLGFFFGIYALNYLGLMLGRSGVIEPWLAAWLSNIVFLFCGLVMINHMR